jgi:hypothetical protein
MRNPFTATRVAVAAGLVGALASLGVAAGAGPLPSVAQLASSHANEDVRADDTVRGNCDEAEHADDATCAGLAPTPGVVVAGEDVRGDCDEAEHATDPICLGTTTTVAPAPPATSPAPIVAVSTPAAVPVDAAGAGTVTYSFDGTTLAVVSATPATGWTVTVERASGRELEVHFLREGRRVDVSVEVEDGAALVRVRVREADDGGTTTTEDHSGPGRGDDDGGHRGPGSGGDTSGRSGGGHDGSDS